ncbi:glycosyltransferase family 4 protein [Vacuolonema iberomarrocanum]|uniref:glycosyltransferase family 4 protein n=1 Tax=Vacuolonema iberomarrocanum TaxID=3454632 RepID=UPI0019DABFE8|nr:glycosyltransferase family 4 protein [filamentous cyanobacterium LEGE 07170]
MPQDPSSASAKTKFATRLLIVTQFFPPDFAATGQLIDELSQQLGKLGLEVSIFTGQPGYAFQNDSAAPFEQRESVSVRRSRVSRWWSHRIRGKALNSLMFCLRAILHLLRHARNYHLLLLTTAPPYLQILGYIVNRLMGVPYVCLIYDLYPDIATALKVVPPQHPLVRLWHGLNRQVWQRSQHIIVLSSTMKQRVIEHCPEVRDRISVIHNWADPNWIVPLSKSKNPFVYTQHLIYPGVRPLTACFTVLYSGNLGRCHDVETLIAAAAHLQDQPVQFIFIGGGAQQPWCQQEAQTLGLTNCHFLPYQDRQKLPYSLTACDLSLVSVKQGMEGLVAPSKLYSGLAAARPLAVICDADSYLVELLTAAGCGQTFRQGDSAGLAAFIQHLMHHPEDANRMGAAGRQYLQSHFTPHHIARQYVEVLCFGETVDVALAPDASAMRSPLWEEWERLYQQRKR